MSDTAEPTRLYSTEAAARAGVAAGTWRGYYCAGRTPGAKEQGPSTREGHPRRADGVDHDRGHARPWWLPETVDAWKADAPLRRLRVGGRPRKP